jgi:hypothetical protein
MTGRQKFAGAVARDRAGRRGDGVGLRSDGRDHVRHSGWAPNAEAEEQKELEALTADTPVWEEWGWGSQAEAAFQLFVRRYRPPTAAAEASQLVPSLVDAYSREWKHEMTTWLRTSEKASPSDPMDVRPSLDESR